MIERRKSTPNPTAVDWSRRLSLEDEDVLFRSGGSEGIPRITIGMPTFKRAHTIRRALASIAVQSYRDFVVIVSDNAGEDPATIEAVRDVAADLPGIILIAQRENIGALANLKRLLGLAETDYFMWLADDDEITPDYLAELVALLDEDTNIVSATGRWRKMLSEQEWQMPEVLETAQTSRAARLFNFVAFGRDDSLFYGLHRSECLRRGRFRGFAWPNRGMLTNWCYVFLFDLVWQGRIGYARNAAWISHNYTEKLYEKADALTVGDRVRTLIRRINVYYLYTRQTAARNPLMLPVILAAALIGFARDIIFAVGRFTTRAITRVSVLIKRD